MKKVFLVAAIAATMVMAGGNDLCQEAINLLRETSLKTKVNSKKYVEIVVSALKVLVEIAECEIEVEDFEYNKNERRLRIEIKDRDDIIHRGQIRYNSQWGAAGNSSGGFFILKKFIPFFENNVII